MALHTLTELRGIFKEPSLLHRWEVEIPTWPSAAVPTNKDILPFFITTAGLPVEQVTEAQIMLGGHTMNFVGKTDRFSEIEWSFFENTDAAVSTYFLQEYATARQQFENSTDITLKSSWSADLMCPIVNMNLFDPAMENITMTYQLINVLFKSSSNGDLGQDPLPHEISITAVFDAFVVIPGGA